MSKAHIHTQWSRPLAQQSFLKERAFRSPSSQYSAASAATPTSGYSSWTATITRYLAQPSSEDVSRVSSQHQRTLPSHPLLWHKYRQQTAATPGLTSLSRDS